MRKNQKIKVEETEVLKEETEVQTNNETTESEIKETEAKEHKTQKEDNKKEDWAHHFLKKDEKAIKQSRFQRKRAAYLKKIQTDENLTEQDKVLLTKASKVRYKPPLSYRSIKIFGLFFLLLPLIIIRIVMDIPSVDLDVIDVVMYVADAIATPLIILAGFILILKRRNKAASMLIVYFVMALFIYIVTIIVFERYLITLISAIHPTWTGAEVRDYTNNLVLTSGAKSVVNYNIFLDLTLCCAFYFFTNITPKKLKGKKLVAFRLCALIPAIYLIVSVVLSGLFNLGIIKINVAEAALLTCRAPATYLVFFGLSLYLALNKHIYKKRGVSEYGYQMYQDTNAHSLQFSIVGSIIIGIVSLIDLIFSFFAFSEAFNFGTSYMMCLVIPFVMLISYRKEYNSATVDFLIPVVYIALIALLIFEIVFQFLVKMLAE